MSKPIKIIKAGPVRVAIFRNQTTREGKVYWMPKITLEVRYKDRKGQWHGTQTMSMHDLPRAIHALEEAYGFLLGKGHLTDDEADSEL